MKKEFCPECRQETTFTLKKIPIKTDVYGEECTFKRAFAFCDNCGGYIVIPKLILDINNSELEAEYKLKQFKDAYGIQEKSAKELFDEVDRNCQPNQVTMDELEAIKKQLEELGWI